MAKQYKVDREERHLPPSETFIINKTRSLPSGMPPTPMQVEEWLNEYAALHVDHTMQTISPVLSKCAEALEAALTIEDLWLPGHTVAMFSEEHIALGSMKKAFLEALNKLKKLEVDEEM